SLISCPPTPPLFPYTTLFRSSHTKNVSDLDAAADVTLAVSRLIPYASGAAFNDLFLWHNDSGWQRLTHKQRFSKVRWLTNDSLRSEEHTSELQSRENLVYRLL